VDQQKPKKATNEPIGFNLIKPYPAGSNHAIDKFKRKIQDQSARIYTKADLLTVIPILQSMASDSMEEKTLLMIKKLKLCCVIFQFSGAALEEVKNMGSCKYELAKENKRKHLVDLIEYVTSPTNWYCEEIVPVALEMVSRNLFRCLPVARNDDWDRQDDEPSLDPQWPHLQLVHEFFLRFIISNQPEVHILSKYINNNNKQFLLNIIYLFQSEDPREREYVKTLLHRIYGKFNVFRSDIRKQINYCFCVVTFSDMRHSGVSELLEIVGSIINGLALPVKDEHVGFLKTVLIPLHKVPSLCQFSQQLAYCVTQFVDKEPNLSSTVIKGLLSFWPRQSASKEQLFLNELEGVLEASNAEEVTKVLHPLFTQIAQCIESSHFQVSERALFLWNNDSIVQYINQYRELVLPIIYPSLSVVTRKHWKSTVYSLGSKIVRMFMEMDIGLWEKMAMQYEETRKEKKKKILTRKYKWDTIRRSATAQRQILDTRKRGN